MEAITKLTRLSGAGYSRLKYIGGKKSYLLAREDMGDKHSPLLRITDDVIKAHLDGSQPIAINLHVGDKKSHFGVLDFDDHDGSRPKQVMIDRVGFVAAALTKIGVAHFVVRSGGGNGYHIWVAWENAKRFDSIRETLIGYLDAANKLLANSPWPSEKFVPDDGKGKGMFFADGDEGKRHFVEIIPKGGNYAMMALPLAGKSVVMTPIGIDAQCGFMKFEDGGDLKVEFAKLKRGPKGGHAQTSQEVDVDVALQCYIKAFRGDDYSNWVRAAFHICGAFGVQGLELYQQYSKQNDGYISESDVSKKWDEIAPSCEPNGYAFWAYARQGGYKGGLPDGIEFTKSGGQQHILNDIVDSFEVFQDLDGIAFARINQRRVLPVESTVFGDLLRRMARKANIFPTAEVIKALQNLTRAESYNHQEDVRLRVAQDGDAIFVDLCDAEDRVMRISVQGGLRILEGEDDCPVAFRRSNQLPLTYDENGTLNDIRSLVNMTDDQFVIFMACAVDMFFADTPSPVVNITGEFGSAKTSATLVMRTLIDPVLAMTAPYSGKIDDLLLRAWHNAVLTLENMSKLTSISDTLCQICTGTGFETRALYTKGDLFTINVKRPVIINGIDPTKYAADLISRMVNIELKQAETKISEREFKRRLDAAAPKMFFATIDLVRRTMIELEAIDVEEYAQRNTRLSTFTAIGEACSRAMGREHDWFVSLLEDQQEEAQLDAAMDNVVYTALNVWGADRSGEEVLIAPQALLRDLKNIAIEHDLGVQRMPITAASFGREMKNVIPMLRKLGWAAEKKSRKWNIVISDPAQQFMEMVEASKKEAYEHSAF